MPKAIEILLPDFDFELAKQVKDDCSDNFKVFPSFFKLFIIVLLIVAQTFNTFIY